MSNTIDICGKCGQYGHHRTKCHPQRDPVTGKDAQVEFMEFTLSYPPQPGPYVPDVSVSEAVGMLATWSNTVTNWMNGLRVFLAEVERMDQFFHVSEAQVWPLVNEGMKFVFEIPDTDEVRQALDHRILFRRVFRPEYHFARHNGPSQPYPYPAGPSTQTGSNTTGHASSHSDKSSRTTSGSGSGARRTSRQGHSDRNDVSTPFADPADAEAFPEDEDIVSSSGHEFESPKESKSDPPSLKGFRIPKYSSRSRGNASAGPSHQTQTAPSRQAQRSTASSRSTYQPRKPSGLSHSYTPDPSPYGESNSTNFTAGDSRTSSANAANSKRATSKVESPRKRARTEPQHDNGKSREIATEPATDLDQDTAMSNDKYTGRMTNTEDISSLDRSNATDKHDDGGSTIQQDFRNKLSALLREASVEDAIIVQTPARNTSMGYTEEGLWNDGKSQDVEESNGDNTYQAVEEDHDESGTYEG